VSCLVDGLIHQKELTNKLFTNSCRVLARSIDDIAASMEASASGDEFYIS